MLSLRQQAAQQRVGKCAAPPMFGAGLKLSRTQMETDREGSADYAELAMSFLEENQDEQKGQGSGLMGFAEVVWKGRPGLQTPQQAGRRRDTCLFGDGWRATERPMVRSGTEVYGCLCKRQQRPREGWVRSVFCCSVASVAGSVHTWSSCSAGDTDRLTRGAGWRRCGPGWARPGWTAAPACTCADEGGWERWGGAGWGEKE